MTSTNMKTKEQQEQEFQTLLVQMMRLYGVPEQGIQVVMAVIYGIKSAEQWK